MGKEKETVIRNGAQYLVFRKKISELPRSKPQVPMNDKLYLNAASCGESNPTDFATSIAFIVISAICEICGLICGLKRRKEEK